MPEAVLLAVAAEDTALARAEVADSAAVEVGVTSTEVEAPDPVAAAEPVTLSTALEAAEEALLATEETTEEACRLLRGDPTTAEAPASARRAVFRTNMVQKMEKIVKLMLDGR